jgi:phage baseplate assembly protein W
MRDRNVDERGDQSQIQWQLRLAERQPGNLYSSGHGAERSSHSNTRKGNVMQIGFPFQIDGRGRTAAASEDTHIRNMIEQLLFTNPGERVNRPDFGSGLLQMVFQPNSPELAATLQFTMQAALQQWLGDLIEVKALEVASTDGSLHVTVQYMVRRSQQGQVAQFSRTF